MLNWMRWVMMLGLLPLALSEVNAAAMEDRLALVIGNSAYQNMSMLANPVNDATDMAAKLRQRGFKVTPLLNASQQQMEQAIESFTGALGGENKIGVFFYAGHGVQVNGENYLIPVDALLHSEVDVKYKTVNAGQLLDRMSAAGNGVNLVILDACRNNPFKRGLRSLNAGLTQMQPAAGTLILYATEPRKEAADGNGRNGTFTKYLLAALDQPGVQVEDVFKQVSKAVKDETGGAQIPWSEGVIHGHFYFLKPVEGKVASPIVSDERAYWDSAQKCEAAGLAECLKAFLKKYPNGEFVELARARLAGLEHQLELMPDTRKADSARRTPAPLIADITPKAFSTATLQSANYLEPELVSIPEGVFQIGCSVSEGECSNDEKPPHTVKVRAFRMSRTEVTQRQWKSVMGSNPAYFQGDDRPVENVSWNDAQNFLQRLNANNPNRPYRLPTEAEWEYAARAGTQTAYSWGQEITQGRANCHGCGGSWGGKETAAVGAFKPNPFALYDMAGNVWEWTCSAYENPYKDSHESQCVNKNFTGLLVIRGGSWYSSPKDLRSARRGYGSADFHYYYLGVRLVQD